ncbi:MAG: YbgA family protein [Bacillaceae bacterium]|nr:YbgA family protein [Bacillaceae bacterium]
MNLTIKTATEKLWAKNKYEIMGKGYNQYKRIKSSFSSVCSTLDYYLIFFDISSARTLPFSKKAIINTLEHIWGYFKKVATETEKHHFFTLLSSVKNLTEDHFCAFPKEVMECLSYVRELLGKYPNNYLMDSTILFPNLRWNEVVVKKQMIVLNEDFYRG